MTATPARDVTADSLGIHRHRAYADVRWIMRALPAQCNRASVTVSAEADDLPEEKLTQTAEKLLVELDKLLA